MTFAKALGTIGDIINTRVFDPLLQRNFLFFDVTDITSAMFSVVMSANTVDIPGYDFNIETINPLNFPGKKHFYTGVEMGDFTFNRGNFVHDLYSVEMIDALVAGRSDFFPRRDFLVIQFLAFNPLLSPYGDSGLLNHSESDTPESVADLVINTLGAIDATRLLNAQVPGKVYLMKDCMPTSINIVDGLDASSSSMSFTEFSFAVGTLKIGTLTDIADLF